MTKFYDFQLQFQQFFQPFGFYSLLSIAFAAYYSSISLYFLIVAINCNLHLIFEIAMWVYHGLIVFSYKVTVYLIDEPIQ